MRSNRLGHSASSPQGQARVVAPNALDVRLTQASMPAHRLLGIGRRNHCDIISERCATAALPEHPRITRLCRRSVSREVAPSGRSALPKGVSCTHECIVPVLGSAPVYEHVQTTLDSDFERRRKVHRAPDAGAALAPDEHSFTRLHSPESCSARGAYRQFSAAASAVERSRIGWGTTTSLRHATMRVH